MNDDALSIYDVEHGILTGEIIERQKDQKTKEWKYLINGQTIDRNTLSIIARSLLPVN